MFKVISPRHLFPVSSVDSLLGARIAQGNYPESIIVEMIDEEPVLVPEYQVFCVSFAFSDFIQRYDDFLSWVICFNDKGRWGL